MAAILALSWSAPQISRAQTNGNIEGTVMNIHNNERASVNVPSLTWSDNLATDAQKYAEHLLTLGLGPNDILPHATGTGQGENLSWGTPGFYKVAEGVQQWANEKSNYKGTPISRDDFRPGGPDDWSFHTDGLEGYEAGWLRNCEEAGRREFSWYAATARQVTLLDNFHIIQEHHLLTSCY